MKRRAIRKARPRVVGLLLAAAVLSAGCGLRSYFSSKGGGEESAAAYRELLFRNPNHPRAREIRALLDDADFKAASEEHTARAYSGYLELHPAGKHVRRAKYWSERLSYFDAVSRRDRGALKAFLKRFPESRFASDVEASLQRSEFAGIRKKESVEAYRGFLKRYRKARSEWTEAATQRLERLLLDAAKAGRSERAIERYIFDHPGSPYLAEARDGLRQVALENALRSRDERVWRGLIRRFPGTEEAKAMEEHMEAEALRGAERSGRVAALERYLERYPGSPHKKRILSAIALMVRERNREAHRWVRVQNAEVEVFRPRKCAKCAPELRVHGTLASTDPDFAFDLVLEATLVEGRKACCRTKHRVKGLRPGQSRPFSFPIPGKKPPASGPPPEFKVRIVEGRAYRDPGASRRLDIPGLGGAQKAPADRFAPERVPSLR